MSYARVVKNYIQENCIISTHDEIAPFLKKLNEDFDGHIISIILYGSCLHPSTRKPTSTHDFYLVLDSYYNVLPGIMHSFFNYLLPPNVYYIHLKENNKVFEAKYNTITLVDLQRETSLSAMDIFTLGRFGKKLGLIYIKPGYESSIIDCIYSAMFTNAWLTLFKMGTEFTLDEFIHSLLALSYSGEVRVERDTKIHELFEAGEEYYRYIYGKILDEFSVHTGIVRGKKLKYLVYETPDELKIWRERVNRFIKKSRYMSVMRWPKSIYTFGNYVDYLIIKIERTKGIKIELTPLERRFPLIFGWRHFFKLLRKGMIK